MNDYLKKLLNIIEEHGWAVQYVASDEGAPSFTYTVGLTPKGLPEVIVYGLSYSLAAHFLNTLANKAVERGRFQHGRIFTDLANMPLAILDCNERTPAYMAENLYAEIEVQQLVYPDEVGRFPWDDGYDLKIPIPIHGEWP